MRKKTLVFISGWGFKASIWESIASEFPEHSVMLMEPSCAPPDDDCILIGWSLGGMMAAESCQLFPGRYQKLVTVASNPKFVATQNWPGVDEKNITDFYKTIRQESQPSLAEFMQWVNGNNRNRDIRNTLQSNLMDAAEKNSLLYHLDLLMQKDLRADYANIDIPALHFFGQHDALVPSSCADKIKQFYPHHHVHLMQDAGHIPFLTHRDEFLHHLRQFISHDHE